MFLLNNHLGREAQSRSWVEVALVAEDKRRGVPVFDKECNLVLFPALGFKPTFQLTHPGKNGALWRPLRDVLINLEACFAGLIGVVQRLVMSS